MGLRVPRSYTVLFTVAYVFIIMETHSRRIVLANLTTNPTLSWVKQPIRQATAWDATPRFLVHDNDGIEGIPIPYGVPNASPHTERLIRTRREEALDHFIFLSSDHIRRVVREYVRYCNGARPSQAIHGIPNPYPELKQPPPQEDKLAALPILGGVQHDYRLAA